MIWQLAIGLSVLFSSVTTILQRVLLKDQKTDPIAASIFYLTMCGVLVGAVGIALGQNFFPSDFTSVIPSLVLMTALYGFGNLFLFRALNQIEASRFVVLFSSRSLITALLSWIVLHEILNGTQWIGATLLFLGIVLVTIQGWKFSIEKGDILALLATAAFGAEVVNDRVILQSYDLYPYISVAFLLPALMTAVFFPASARKMPEFFRFSLFRKVALPSVTYTASAMLFFVALTKSGNTSQVAVINVSSVVITAVLSIVLLRERTNMAKKFTGALCAFIGLIFIG